MAKTGRSKIPYSFTLEEKHVKMLRQKQAALRKRGYKKCTRSQVVRLALENLDVLLVPIP